MRSDNDEYSTNIMVTFHLPPLLASVFELLIANKFITDAQIAELHTRTDIENAPVRMTIYRLRTALKPYNIEIYNDRAAGYWITHTSKVAIRELLESDIVPETKVTRSPIEDAPEREIPNEAIDGCVE